MEEICDRVALIHQAKKILEGRVSAIREERKNGNYAVRFSGSMIAFVNALWTNFELIDKEIIGENRYLVHVKMRGEAGFEELLQSVMGQVKLEAAWEVLPSMHDVFIQTVSTKEEVTNA